MHLLGRVRTGSRMIPAMESGFASKMAFTAARLLYGAHSVPAVAPSGTPGESEDANSNKRGGRGSEELEGAANASDAG